VQNIWPHASANLDFADERCARLWIIHKVVRKRDAMQLTASKEIESLESVRVRVFACVQLISRPVRPRRVLFKRCYLHLAFGSHSALPAAVSFKLTTHSESQWKPITPSSKHLKRDASVATEPAKESKKARERRHTRPKQRRSQKAHSYFLLSLQHHDVVLATCESCDCPKWPLRRKPCICYGSSCIILNGFGFPA
jgi:hypothetical protein